MFMMILKINLRYEMAKYSETHGFVTQNELFDQINSNNMPLNHIKM